MKKRVSFVLSLIFLLGISVFAISLYSPGGSADSTNVIKVTQCGTLSQSGATYVLQNDIVYNYSCFIINSNDTTLDGNGYKIVGNRGTGGYGGVYISYLGKFPHNDKIFNLTIYNASLGIYAAGSNLILANNRIENSLTGIALEGSDINITGNLISNNDNDGVILFYSGGTNHINVINNEITNNGHKGIGLGTAGWDYTFYINNTNILNNVIANNKEGGISLDSSDISYYNNIAFPVNVAVSNNLIDGNGGYGISLGGTNNTVNQNSICNNDNTISIGDNDNLFNNFDCNGDILQGEAIQQTPYSSQTILQLYQNNNSHAALWNQTLAPVSPVDISFNKIFGFNYTGANPHACTGTNLVLKLYQNSNSHTATPDYTGSGYNVNVCYGNLKCVSVSDGQTPPQGSKFVVSLYQNNNSHVSTTSISGGYSIYCNAQTLQSVNWQDFEGNVISKSYLGNSVRLVANTASAGGTEITFTISGTNGFSKTLTALTDSSGKAVAVWGISKTALKDGGANFTFTASDSLDTQTKTSGNLEVENYPNNTLPELNITSIKDRQMYFAGVPILFNATCTDKESQANISWSIEGSGTDYNSNDLTFNETFTKKGMKTISITCVDSSGKSDDKQISILIIPSKDDPDYLLNYINQPSYNQLVKDKNLRVSFSASDSYLVNIKNTQTCNPTITCLAGTCPLKTQNSPAGCTNPVSVTDGGKDLGFNNIYFSWKFDDGYNVSGLGNSYVSGSRIYGVPSVKTNDKIIDLTESYYNGTENLTQTVERRFTLETDNFCLPLQNEYLKAGPEGVKSGEMSLSDPGVCAGPNGIAENYSRGDDCCPLSQICVAPNGNNNLAGCVQPKIALNFTSCGDYTTQSLCSTDPYRVADNPNNPERTTNPACGSIINGTIIQCNGCFWKESADNSTGGLCGLNKTIVSISGIGNCAPATCGTSSQTIQGCSQGLKGYKKVSITETFNPGSCLPPITANSIGCASTTQTVKCVQGVELPFFDLNEFLIALVAILGIYGLFKFGKHRQFFK